MLTSWVIQCYINQNRGFLPQRPGLGLCCSVRGSSLVRSDLGKGFKNKTFKIITIKGFFVFSLVLSIDNVFAIPHDIFSV